MGTRLVHTLPPTSGPATQWGRWLDRSRVEVIGDTSNTRRVLLLSPLWWEDPAGQLHVVPDGFSSDGASLPRFAWWIMGGRLNLDYIRAAVVHDFACMMRKGTKPDASTRFYRGLRADGMGFNRARVCYHAVMQFGPQEGWAVA